VGLSDGDAYTLSASDARMRALKFVRRMGDDYARVIDFVTSGRVNVRAVVTHRESLHAAPCFLTRWRIRATSGQAHTQSA
jgi:L-iditol 2-dehydrogenase